MFYLSRNSKITTILLIIKCLTKFVQTLNISEIDSFVLLHDRVKNTLVEIAINGRCDTPRPTVVYVNDTRDKLYLPRATILYRCSDQFACCPNPRHSCVAIEEQEVDIGFYTLIKSDEGIIERNIEILKFQNHTKCNCRRNDGIKAKDILHTVDSIRHEIHVNTPSVMMVKVNETTDGNYDNVKTFIEKQLLNTSTIPHIQTESNNSSKLTTILTTTSSPKTSHSSIIPTIKWLLTSGQSLNKSLNGKTNHSVTPTMQSTNSISSSVTSAQSLWISLKTRTTTTSTPLMTTSKELTSNSFAEYTKQRPVIKTTANMRSIENFDSFTSTPQPKTTTRAQSRPTAHSTPTPSPPPSLTTIPTTGTTEKTPTKTSVRNKSTINYGELEREDDLNPDEEVVYSANGFNVFFTNDIFFRPLTSGTTPIRALRPLLVTKKCG